MDELLTQYTVADPLHFDGVQGQPAEWTNTSKLIARFLIRNQQHLMALVQYSYERSKEETTASLRSYAEKNVNVSSI